MMRDVLRAGSIAAAGLLLVPLLAGCSGTRLLSWPWLKDEIPTASDRNPVHRIICMWEPSEGRGPDGLPARGFAGQVLFFTRTSSVPVKIEGDVRVYVFDELGPAGDPTKPLHQFDFLRSEEGDAWNRHLTISTLGPSYSVFIPYTRRGRHEARCAVQVRYTPPGGLPLFSDMATIVLPGPSDSGAGQPAVQPQPLPQPVQTVSHYIDGPYGRQLVGGAPPPGWQPGPQASNVVPSSTQAIGSVVRTADGIAVRQPQRPHLDSAVEPASARAPLARAPAPTAAQPATSEADRLDRIEQMLEQLAKQVQSTSQATPSAAVPGPDAISTGRHDLHRAAHSVPAQVEPAALDRAALDRTARRLPPRPSWFDQSVDSADPPWERRGAFGPERHPLRSAAQQEW
jgi:hypothetical protein